MVTTIYGINDYFGVIDTTDTRVEVYSDSNIAARLLSYHKSNGAADITLSECVAVNASHLSMPADVMHTLDAKIKNAKGRAIITGIDAYLSLLDGKNVKLFMSLLFERIDSGKHNASYMISKSRFDDSKFKNPKYENSLQVVRIGHGSQDLVQPIITIVSQKWKQEGNHLTSWNALLEILGKIYQPDSDRYTLVLKDYTQRQAGLSDNISQLFVISEIAEQCYGLSVSLPKNVLETLILGCRDKKVSPQEFLESKFGRDNTNKRSAVKRLIDLRKDELWQAYVWLLQNTINIDSYLMRVLSMDLTADTLLQRYVCDVALTVITDQNAKKFADERKIAVNEIRNVEPSLIIDFISKVKHQHDDIVACWLNCDTEAERIEIVRRVSESDMTGGLPSIWHSLFPSLADYLSDLYPFINNDLTNYFRDYRRQKIANRVKPEFVKRAFDFILPDSIGARDALLRDLYDENTALIEVDGMGAEYIPFICARSERISLNVESVAVVRSKLPTSTEFNSISWDENRRLPDMHGIDNITHDGAVKYDKCTPPQNFVATVAVLEGLITRVANALVRYDRVIVTSDHGSSRLAVLAHEEGLSNTIKIDGKEPKDWRYTIAPPNETCPSEFVSFYDPEKDISYWIVRGYNRLPKSGGKTYSLHGGATPEERLVPLIVFSKIEENIVPKRSEERKDEQIVEKAGFDI